MLNPGTVAAPTQAAIDALFDLEFEEHQAVAEATARSVRQDFHQALALLERSIRQGGKVLVFGNGGSASDAQHIAAELVVRYKADRKPIAAIALTTDTSILTACGNDMGFEALFERQVEALGRPEDVAIGLSTSGKSPNVLRGLRQARNAGLGTVGLSGGGGGDMRAVCDCLISVPSAVTARIQEMHITLGHLLCLALERKLGLA